MKRLPMYSKLMACGAGTMVEQVKSVPAIAAYHVRASVRVSAAPVQIQLFADVPNRAGNGSSTWASPSCVGPWDGIPGSCFCLAQP